MKQQRRAGAADRMLDIIVFQPAGVYIADANEEPPVAVILAVERSFMAAAREAQGTLLHRAAVDVHADRDGAVVGVRPGRNVLVPLEAARALLRLHVELGMMELDVRPDDVGGKVGHHWIADELPEHWMLVLRAGHAMQPRRGRRMALFEHPDVVSARDPAAALHQLVERILQTPHPGRRHVVGKHEKAIGEKSRALGLGEHASGMLEHVLTQHAGLPDKSPSASYSA